MRFAFALLAASAGFVAAQSTTSTAPDAISTDECDAADIVNNCLQSTQIRIDDCSTQDYECLCRSWEAQLTCWDNCPDDARSSAASSSVTSYCQAASAQSSQSEATASSSSTSSASSSDSTSTESTSTSTATTTGSDDSSATETLGASSTETPEGFAPTVGVPSAGSMFAVLLGIFGML